MLCRADNRSRNRRVLGPAAMYFHPDLDTPASSVISDLA